MCRTVHCAPIVKLELSERSAGLIFAKSAEKTIMPHHQWSPDKQHLLHDKCILLVEDNPINQLVASEMLLKFGATVKIAKDGVEALQLLSSAASFDLILMDIQMPNMDGYQTTRALRELPDYQCVPVIAFTAHAIAGYREECLAAGMDDFITKPIKISHLISTVWHWLEQRRNTQQTQLAFQ